MLLLLLLQVASNSTKPDLRDIHSIPAGKVDAAAAAAIQVPDTYPHFTPFVENKRQVRQVKSTQQARSPGTPRGWLWRAKHRM